MDSGDHSARNGPSRANRQRGKTPGHYDETPGPVRSLPGVPTEVFHIRRPTTQSSEHTLRPASAQRCNVSRRNMRRPPSRRSSQILDDNVVESISPNPSRRANPCSSVEIHSYRGIAASVGPSPDMPRSPNPVPGRT